MARSPPGPDGEPTSAPGPVQAAAAIPVQRLWADPVLRIAFLAAGLLLAYQLIVTLLQPAWIGPVTDWLRVLLAWPTLVGMVLLSLWFTRAGQRGAASWWLVSGALFSYALARTVWLVENQFLFPDHVPFPSWSDLFYALQYPFFLLALLLVPRVHPRIQRARVVLDACLLVGAAFGLSWYFLLAPIYLNSHETLLGKLINLSYPVGDLAIFFGLTVIWLTYRLDESERAVMALLFAAIVCLVVADSWVATILLHTSSYQTGSPSDLFWMAFYLLVPLAALVQYRLMQRTLAGVGARSRVQQPANLRRQDLIAGLRVTAPIAAALLASTVLFIQAEVVTAPRHPLAPPLIALGLLGLALLRQGLTAVDNERLRREREEALRATTAQMETFLGIAGHELKNPLASMRLGLEMVEQRIRRLLRREQVEATDVAPLLEPVVQAERQGERLQRLVTDLVDVARVRAGRLELHLEPTDLAAVVRQAVEEQHQLNPERILRLVFAADLQVPVTADTHRLGQVVTNYLTNALKYSPADRPVEVGLQVNDQQARVWVRDEGPGLPPQEQERIWERFHRAQGIEVLSGSGVGLGLGLHISRTIIEQHQGQVGVQSAPGQGATFWFSLPLATPEPA
jgi:signal transduction histidine kinase